MRRLISTKKKKKAQAGNEWSNILQKSSQARKKPPPQPPPSSPRFVQILFTRMLSDSYYRLTRSLLLCPSCDVCGALLFPFVSCDLITCLRTVDSVSQSHSLPLLQATQMPAGMKVLHSLKPQALRVSFPRIMKRMMKQNVKLELNQMSVRISSCI